MSEPRRRRSKKRATGPKYRHIERLGIAITADDHGSRYVTRDEINRALDEKQRRQFAKLFGVQTCVAGGMFPWDVEAVLVRMFENRLTGSQLEWD